ncbi:hypothetical protein FR483_n800L [Paramecium bursaria Chlorella virus FR483]|uniref:Uncharacterized protein n800L n=1 Tax=Paramecium bursaria Chlorella virus FR483 TaxID=399781 RepID=A7J8F4_PBCVF|nr:hypothetical protein FR483_n800L [Paramecium bursaria Chlorella virus FR483]ABT16085.1 hypothetical protein FR483_n800L [Paramecium bursaria Chlorella virus FR483]
MILSISSFVYSCLIPRSVRSSSGERPRMSWATAIDAFLSSCGMFRKLAADKTRMILLMSMSKNTESNSLSSSSTW